MMEMDEYAIKAATTAIYPDRFNLVGNVPGIVYNALGLAGEAGELANNVKKIIRDDGGTLSPGRREKLIGELGDVLWYAAAMAKELGIPLSIVALRNLQKLADRKRLQTLSGSDADGSRETFGVSEAIPGRFPTPRSQAVLEPLTEAQREANRSGGVVGNPASDIALGKRGKRGRTGGAVKFPKTIRIIPKIKSELSGD